MVDAFKSMPASRTGCSQLKLNKLSSNTRHLEVHIRGSFVGRRTCDGQRTGIWVNRDAHEVCIGVARSIRRVHAQRIGA